MVPTYAYVCPLSPFYSGLVGLRPSSSFLASDSREVCFTCAFLSHSVCYPVHVLTRKAQSALRCTDDFFAKTVLRA